MKIKGKVYKTVVRRTDVRSRDMGVEEGTGKEIRGRGNDNATMDVRSLIRSWTRSEMTTKVVEITKKAQERRLKWGM